VFRLLLEDDVRRASRTSPSPSSVVLAAGVVAGLFLLTATPPPVRTTFCAVMRRYGTVSPP